MAAWPPLPAPGKRIDKENSKIGRGAFVPLAFQPGEAFQFDSHEHVRVKTNRKILHRLSVSLV
jgi:hypothetical protein